MTRPEMARIERKCPECGASNRVITPDVRPSWRINCSSCGTLLVERRGFRPRVVVAAARDRELGRGKAHGAI